MEKIFQLFFIGISCASIENSQESDLTCVKLRNIALRIPLSNDVVGAYPIKGALWYGQLTWSGIPAGELMVHYRIEYWNDHNWVTIKDRSVNVFNRQRGTEGGNIAHFVRIAMGIDRCYSRIGNRSRAPVNLFVKRKCWQLADVIFDFWSHKYRFFLDVSDDEDRSILSGLVAIEPMG